MQSTRCVTAIEITFMNMYVFIARITSSFDNSDEAHDFWQQFSNGYYEARRASFTSYRIDATPMYNSDRRWLWNEHSNSWDELRMQWPLDDQQ